MCPRTRRARGNELSGGSIKIFQVITHVRGRSKNRYFFRTICTTRAPPGDPYYREGAIGDALCCGMCCWFCSAMDVLPIWSRWWCHCCWERRSLHWKSCMGTGTGDEAMHKMTRQNAVTGQYGQLSTSVPIKTCQKFKKVFRDCSLCQPFAWSSTNEPSHQLRIADGHTRGTCT